MARTLRSLIFILVVVAVGIVVWGVVRWRSAPRSGTSEAEGIAPGGGLVASVRSEPPTYNRYAPGGSNAGTDLLALLTHAPLVRIDRATDTLEPWLAETWTTSEDGRTFTLRLREGLRFSDGEPFSSADVLFSFRAVYDPAVKSALQPGLLIKGKPLSVTAADARTVVVSFPERFGPGLRILHNMPMLPRHKLEASLDAGTFAEEWVPATPIADIAGLGPFVLAEHVSGQRLVLRRNPHYFRRDDAGRQLPYLDRLTLAVAPDQTSEALRLEAGEIDLMANGEIRPQDYARFKRLQDEGRVRLLDVGVGLDPDFLSFNLGPGRAADPRSAWFRRRELRHAISLGVDRQAIVNAVYLGSAVPMFGPVSPGNRTWHAPGAQKAEHDPARARQFLGSIGLRDANADGMLEDAAGAPARFSILTQAGHNRERVSTVIQEQLRQIGLAVDIVGLDPRGLFQRWSSGDWDTLYFGVQATSTDPVLNPEFWLSSGEFHMWNPGQTRPATEWEARVDALMLEQSTTADLAERQKSFAEVQRILAEQLPVIHFVAPRVTLAISSRVRNSTPAPQLPQLLWSADTLAVGRR